MKGPLLAIVWIASLGGAFAAGGALATSDDEPSADGDRAALEKKVEELTRRIAEERTRRPRAESSRAAAADEATEAPATEPVRAVAGKPLPSPAGGAAGAPPAKFSLDGVKDPAEASKLFMEFADAQLARGEAGYAAILDAMGEVWKQREQLQALFGDEAAAVRHLYPWVRFLVEREGPVVDFSEAVFRNMAEKPEWFENVPDDDVLEPITEGLGFLLPGAIPEERLAVFRGHATKFLELPQDKLPKALRQSRSDVERLVGRFWAAPLTVEQAIEKLKSGSVPTTEIARLVRLVPAETLASIDVTALVEPLLRTGNYDAMRVLAAVPAANLDAGRIDAALLASMEQGTGHASFVANCIRYGRKQWADVRSLIDRAFAGNDSARTCATQILGMLPANLRPDKAYVEDVIARGVVPAAMVPSLNSVYGLK